MGKKFIEMRVEKVKISELKNNNGQIVGLPKNPRFIKDAKFEKLKQSILDDTLTIKRNGFDVTNEWK